MNNGWPCTAIGATKVLFSEFHPCSIRGSEQQEAIAGKRIPHSFRRSKCSQPERAGVLARRMDAVAGSDQVELPDSKPEGARQIALRASVTSTEARSRSEEWLRPVSS